MYPPATPQDFALLMELEMDRFMANFRQDQIQQPVLSVGTQVGVWLALKKLQLQCFFL